MGAADLENERLTEQASLAEFYFELRGQDALQDLYNRTIAADRQSLELTRALVETGIDNPEAVAQAEVTLADAEAAGIGIATNRALYEHAMATLIGKPASSFSMPVKLLTTPIPAIPVLPYGTASASYNIDYDLVDLDYRGLFISSNRYAVNFLIGARYARLQQDFGGTFTDGGITNNINTDITFTGGGIRVGLEGERFAARSGLMVYGRTDASFVAGKFNVSEGPATLVSDRVVPILELELGVGWVSPSGHFRISGGYLFNAWYNVMRTSDLVSAASPGSFINSSGQSITFDGLVIHAETRF